MYFGTSQYTMQDKLNTHLTIPASLIMSNTGWIGSSSGQITTHIEIESVEYNSVKLRFALIEHNLSYQGVPYNYVCRDLLPEETLNITSPGQTFDINRTFSVSGGWNSANMDIVTFVQYDGNKNILQACMGMDSPPSDFTVTLTYNYGSPVPAYGGTINFDVFLQNNEVNPVSFDLWIEIPPQVTPPGVPNRSLTFPAGFSITRPDMDWPIPANWPAGNYSMVWNVGDLSTQTAWATDSFPFVKSADDDGSGYALWEIEGDPLDQLFDDLDLGGTVTAAEFALLGCYPNPFNPSTTISYTLPEAGKVLLSVYDVNGRLVSSLVDGYRETGTHEATFDASNLPSGIYIYRLTAGEFNATGKMVLTK